MARRTKKPSFTETSGHSTNPPLKYGVLTADEIKRLGLICHEFDGKFLKAASYDLRLGTEVFYCSEKGDRGIITLSDTLNHIKLDSFESAIFSTFERVKIPSGIVGRFDLKISKGLRGLILQVGPQVEPGYEGPLFGLVLNTSGEAKSVKFKEDFLTIEFSYTCDNCSTAFVETNVSNLNEFLNLKQIELQELQHPNVIDNLRRELESCKREHSLKTQGEDRRINKSILKWTILGVILAVIILFASILIADCGGIRSKFGSHFYSQNHKKIEPQSSEQRITTPNLEIPKVQEKSPQQTPELKAKKNDRPKN